MLYERQKTLLTLLSSLGGDVGALDFQKLLFLYCQEWQESPSYDFVPYRFGGFSFTSYADKRKLIQLGLLVDDERSWKIAKASKVASTIGRDARERAARFVARYKNLRGDDLVADVYRRYPYYAIRSEVAAKLLHNQSKAIKAIDSARPTKGVPGVVTLGYEGRTLESYLNVLIRNGITLLCDVRRNPLSRKYGFSKGTLSNGCTGVGIRYEHLPQLGIASEDRRELETQADYDALFAAYRRDSLPKEGDALRIIQGWVAKGERVALTCFEKLPEQCHRHCVAEALQKKFGKTYSPVHL